MLYHVIDVLMEQSEKRADANCDAMNQLMRCNDCVLLLLLLLMLMR